MWARGSLFGCIALLLACGGAEEPPAEEVPGATGEASAAALATPAQGPGALYFVRLIARGDQYAFEPAEVRIRPGDVVRFVNTDHQPESVAFEIDAAPPQAREFLDRAGLRTGPLLTEPGAFFDVSFEDAPPGVYPFASVPHGDRGMRGRIVVEAG
jgi:plastocyanin